ncbi:MAG: UDP-N-acetylmuramate dehydrogenase [Clostridiales bacterium]|nr:UDP-N-acetylmuramate dehydrogenase [Clostridiales bacterium]
MVAEAWIEELQGIVGKKNVTQNAPMSRYTTLRLGGPAELLCEITSEDALSRALAWASRHDVPLTVIGNGSNLLVKDGGIRGLVVHIGDGFSRISGPVPLPDGRFALTAQGGALLSSLANAAASHGLAGLEFSAGIPGTVGGAVYMNAGAYGGEMKDVVTSVTAYDFTGKPLAFLAEDLHFGYRQSRFSVEEPAAVATVTVTLSPGEEDAIWAAMREFNSRRKEKQPLQLPSCGSTFKRPPDRFTGPLIEKCDLKGCRIGGASVSQLHAGFLVNDQEGTAADFLALIAHVQRVVLEQTGVELQPEVRILGEDAPAREV